MKGSPTQKGDSWLQQAADLLAGMGFKDRVFLENTGKVLTGEKQVLGYYSWGSNDPAIHIRHFGFEFVPGALAGMFVSSDGRTFGEPPADWKVGKSWDDKSALFAGSPQSLAGDLIHDGITGIAGHVAEPYLEATIRPNILFPAYLSGFNLIESYYLAMPSLSWQTVVLGDPLCAPFRTVALTSNEIDKGIDPDTELPFAFSTRRLRAYSVSGIREGVHPDTVRLILRAEARLIKKDQAGAKKALEEAIARDNRLPAQQLLLATMYESAHEYDKAIERYRRLQEISPNNALVLNNLAYALAVRKKNVQEALPLAEKAYALAKDSANVSDTLGWIYYLAGQNDKAVKILEEAAKAGPNNADIQLHLAIVKFKAGDRLATEGALKRALEIDPKLEQSEDVKQLRAKMK
jgi:tetratricopeptide (TPR) repeat protein